MSNNCASKLDMLLDENYIQKIANTMEDAEVQKFAKIGLTVTEIRDVETLKPSSRG